MSTAAFTSLHGGLIARKGEASPSPAVTRTYNTEDSVNSSGFSLSENPSQTPTPMEKTSTGVCAPVKLPAIPASRGKNARVKAVTLRIDPELYHRIHVAAAKLDLSGQDVLRAAVTKYLDYLVEEVFPDCGCVRGDAGCDTGRPDDQA